MKKVPTKTVKQPKTQKSVVEKKSRVTKKNHTQEKIEAKKDNGDLTEAEKALNEAAKRLAALKTKKAVKAVIEEEIKVALGKKKVHSMVHRLVQTEVVPEVVANVTSASPPSDTVMEPPKKDQEVATHKVCRVCGTNHPLEMYSRDKSKKDGLDTVCKPCGKAYRSPEAKAERARKKKLKEKRNKSKNK
jgi:hypothetical protein